MLHAFSPCQVAVFVLTLQPLPLNLVAVAIPVIASSPVDPQTLCAHPACLQVKQQEALLAQKIADVDAQLKAAAAVHVSDLLPASFASTTPQSPDRVWLRFIMTIAWQCDQQKAVTLASSLFWPGCSGRKGLCAGLPCTLHELTSSYITQPTALPYGYLLLLLLEASSHGIVPGSCSCGLWRCLRNTCLCRSPPCAASPGV